MTGAPKNIITLINEIKRDFTNGSTTIALNSLEALEAALLTSGATNIRRIIKFTASELIKAKPEMAAQENILKAAAAEIINSGNIDKGLSIIERFRTVIKKAVEICVHKAYENLFRDANKYLKILTCSYSSTFIAIMSYAKSKGINFSVCALESQSKNISYGEATVEKCRKIGIESILAEDSGIEEAIENSSFILTGADRILPDRGIINGSPSKKLAESAYGKIPYFVIAESFKRGILVEPGDGFDYTPAIYISSIFSDNLFC